MDYSDGYNRSSNFGIKQLDKDKVLIQIPFGNLSWEKEYNINDPISKILNDFKAEKGIDIPDNYLKKLKINKNSLNETDKIKIFFEGNLMASYLVGKPFNNPFEVFIFNKNNKILNIQTFDNELIKSMGLDDYGASSAYCNGNNHLYISGGETSGNQIIDKFFDINLNNNSLDGPYEIPPKKIHSMIFIPPEKVFIVGGNDKKTFCFNAKQKQIIYLNDLNIIRTEPALQVIGNILYCFDNVNKADNEQISFEKIDIENPDAQWELIYPSINQAKFPQKFFAVSKDNTNENIIFLGGNMDDNMAPNDLKNYKYNIEANLIETFYVKNKERFEKINYLPTQEINENMNYIHKNKYNESKYDFNMPGIQSVNIETQIRNNIQYDFDIKNLKGNGEPYLNNNRELGKNDIKIEQEPALKEPEIEPNMGDQQIDIDIPNQLNEFGIGINNNKNNMNKEEEEKNSEKLTTLDMKIKYQGKPITYDNNMQPDYDIKKFHSSVNDPGNELNPVKRSQLKLEEEKLPENYKIGYDINLPKLNGQTNVNLEIQGGNNDEIMAPTIHMPKPEGIKLNDIQINTNTQQNNLNIDMEGVNDKLKESGKIKIGTVIEPNIDIQKGIDTNIQGGTVNIKGPEVKINGENLNIENKNNYGFLEGGTIIGDKESRSKDKKFDLYGIIVGPKITNQIILI